jgi:hypothetical protein
MRGSGLKASEILEQFLKGLRRGKVSGGVWRIAS